MRERMVTVLMAAWLPLTLMLGFPAAALAGTVEHRRVVTSVGGPEAVAAAIGMLRAVDVGASAATLTLDVDGSLRELRLDFGSMEREVTGADRPLLLPLVLLGAVVSGAVRVTRLLTRMMRGRV